MIEESIDTASYLSTLQNRYIGPLCAAAKMLYDLADAEDIGNTDIEDRLQALIFSVEATADEANSFFGKWFEDMKKQKKGEAEALGMDPVRGYRMTTATVIDGETKKPISGVD
jgi:hypothetical protein